MKKQSEKRVYIGRPCTKITDFILDWIADYVKGVNEERPILFILSGGVIDENQIKEKLRKIVNRWDLQKIHFDKGLSVALLNKLLPESNGKIISCAAITDWTRDNCKVTDNDLIKKISFELQKLSSNPKNMEFSKKKFTDIVDIEELYGRYKVFLEKNNLSDAGTACDQLVNAWNNNPELSKDKSSKYSGIVIYDAFKFSEDKLRVLNLLLKHQERYLIAGDKCSKELAYWRNLPKNIFSILSCVTKDTYIYQFKENVVNTKNTNEVLNNCYSELGDKLKTVSYREPGEINEIGYIESEEKLEEFIISFAQKYPKEKLLFCINNRNKVSELSFKTKRFPNLTIETPYMAPKFEIDRTVLFINNMFFSRYDTPIKKVKDLSRMLANALLKSKGQNILLVIGANNCEQIKDYISTIKRTNQN